MTTTAPGLTAALAERAVHAAHAHRAADPDGFHHRHDDPDQWNRWTRRARVARTIAAALQVGVDGVLVTDDPHRQYRTRTGPGPGDLITITDPVTGRAWRFIPDFTTPGDGWLLLDRCPGCDAEVPVHPRRHVGRSRRVPRPRRRQPDRRRGPRRVDPPARLRLRLTRPGRLAAPEPTRLARPEPRNPHTEGGHVVTSNAHGTTTPTNHARNALPAESVLFAPASTPAVPLRPPVGAWGLVVVAVRTTDAAGAPVRLTGDAPAPDPALTDTAALLAGVWLPAPPPAALHTGTS